MTGRGGGGRGPELSPLANAGTWTLALNGGIAGSVAQDASGIHFVASQNVATASIAIALEDNATYEVSITVANLTLGNLRVLVYGATTAHLGAGGTLSANGQYTFQVQTIAAGTLTNTLRIQATGTNGNNTFDVTAISLKRVL